VSAFTPQRRQHSVNISMDTNCFNYVTSILSSQTWLHQIGDGLEASIHQEWDRAVELGHSRQMRLALRASITQAL